MLGEFALSFIYIFLTQDYTIEWDCDPGIAGLENLPYRPYTFRNILLEYQVKKISSRQTNQQPRGSVDTSDLCEAAVTPGADEYRPRFISQN